MRRGHEHRRVDAVRRVAEARVLPRHPRGGDRVAGRGPAVGVDAQPGADPLAEGIAPRRGLGRQVRLEQVPHRDALGGEDPPGGHVVEPDLGDVERVEAGAAAFQQRDAEHREVEVVVLRDPVDVLGEARRTAGPVPRPALGDLVRRPSAVNQPRTGQLPVASAIARMPARGMFSTGLPSTQPAARPSQAPAIRSGSSEPRAARPGRPRRGSPRTLPARPRRADGKCVELVEQFERERPQLRRDGLLGGPASGCRRAAGREPAPLDAVDVLALLPRLPELVPDQVLGLDPGHPHAQPHLAGRERSQRLRPLLVPLHVAGEDLRRDDGHRPARLLDVDPARGRDVVDPVAAERDCRAHPRAHRPSRRSSRSRGRS